MHTSFIVQHNFSDGRPSCSYVQQNVSRLKDLAQKFRCAQTKTTAILNNTIRTALHESLVTYMQNRPFSICNDGCSDSGIKKMNPVCVNIFDAKNSSELQTKFYDILLPQG